MAVMERDNKIKQLEDELKDLREEKHPDNIETSMGLDLLSEQLSITNEANNILRDQIQEMTGQQRHIADQLEDARQRIECLVDESNRYFSQRQEYWDWYLERGERLIMMDRVVTTLTDNPGEPDIDIMTEEENICPICYDTMDRKGVRTNKCVKDHGICFSKMCAQFESLSCPLCRNQIKTETALIE